MFEVSSGKLKKAQKVVIYGVEGIGKTTFASCFPNVGFIDVEDSTTHLDVKRLPKPSSWTMLIQQVKHVKDNQLFGTLAIDTLDKAEELCKQHVMTSNGWTAIDSEGYGKKFVALEKEFGNFLNLLSDVVDSGINVVLVAHAIQRKVEEPDQLGQYDHYELKLEKRNGPLPKEWADAVLFAKFKNIIITDSKSNNKKATGGQRVMYTTHNPAWDAKNRWGLAGELPFEYSQIAQVFHEATAVVPPIMTPPVQQEVSLSTEPQANTQPVIEPDFGREAIVEVSPHIPKSIADLMQLDHVTTEEIMAVIHTGGFMPVDTPVENVPSDLWDYLVTNWSAAMNLLNTKIRAF
ncbi:ATP-binding protein [Jeotgalibaca porci]|uniref:ATP-binding protein n=1 Tax=Jeotgalibaca porci TaxID=1868793 RepID=UPI0035A1AAF5